MPARPPSKSPLTPLLRPLAWAWHLLQYICLLLGPFALTALILQFTPVPLVLLSRLANPPTTSPWRAGQPQDLAPAEPPGAILLFAGSGIPGESSLNRIWHAADAARAFPEARVFLAIPSPAPDQPSPAAAAYLRELALRGVDPQRVTLLPAGGNTYQQCGEAAQVLSPLLSSGTALLVVTSPEHMYRSVACLRARGFAPPILACPAYSKSLDDPHPAPPEWAISPATLEPVLVETPASLPDDAATANSLPARSTFFDQLRENLDASRKLLDEACALAAYRFRSWM